jgi:hypothetical protein
VPSAFPGPSLTANNLKIAISKSHFGPRVANSFRRWQSLQWIVELSQSMLLSSATHVSDQPQSLPALIQLHKMAP